MECYNCGAILNRRTRSAEHILPGSIGGRRKAYNLLCKACNESFGRSIDNELALKLARFYTMLTTKEQEMKKDAKSAAFDRFLKSVKENKSFSGSKGYFRSIAKICLNYYLSKGYSREYIQTVKALVNGQDTDAFCFYYAADNYAFPEIPDNEISHIIHICGNSTTGLLYAYIELFNMQNLVFVFSREYKEKNINVSYCRNLISDEEIIRNIALDITQENLEELQYSSAMMEELLYPRFERIMKIIQTR